MSSVYTYSKARQNLASLLEQALQDGEVKIKRKDGQVFIVKPESKEDSPLAVEGVSLGLTRDEIIKFIRQSRKYSLEE